jgi:hypothetical protein
MNHKEIVGKYREQISKILKTKNWDITGSIYKVSFSEKFSAGKYSLISRDENLIQNSPDPSIGGDDPDRKITIASFELIPMINCCGILVSTRASVEKRFRALGLGTILNSLRIDMARDMGYGILMATEDRANEAQSKIFKQNGWNLIKDFINPRTSHRVGIFTINL